MQHQLIMASEKGKSIMGSRFHHGFAVIALFSALNTVQANPLGPSVQHGAASIDGLGTSNLTVTNTPNAIINWQQFNIGANELTRFLQQNADSAVLNRVTGVDPSQILGSLVSNGRVFVINPNGLVFGQNAIIDTAGFMASTLNITDADFLNGRFNFEGLDNAAEILNQGFIHSSGDGDVILIAPTVKNEGVIETEGGDITIAAGQSVTLSNLNSPYMTFEVQADDNQAINLGSVITKGGSAQIFAGSIHQGGVVSADTISTDADGNIVLSASDQVSVSGRVSNTSSSGQGGDIRVLGDNISIESGALVEASGQTGGGTILIGGDKLGQNPDITNAQSVTLENDSQVHADAITAGDGGKVILFAENAMTVHGEVTAKGGNESGDGGFIETSGLKQLDITQAPDASAVNGDAGEWLIDPNNITIQATGPDANISGTPNHSTTDDSAILTTGTIQTALNGGTSVTVTTTTSGTNSQAGDITVNDPITKSAGLDATLTLSAHNDININADITSTSNQLDLVLIPDSDNPAGTGEVNLGANLDLNGGDLTITGGSGRLDMVGAFSLSYNTANVGTFLAEGATLNGGTMNVASLDVRTGSSVLTGVNATVNVSSDFSLYSSVLGTGALTTLNGSTTDIASVKSASSDTSSQTIYWDWSNHGVINMGGNNGFHDTNLNGTLTNETDGVFNFIGVSGAGGTPALVATSGQTGVFTNLGVVNTNSTSVPTISSLITLTNTGTMNLTSSGLIINSPGTSSGTINISHGNTLDIGDTGTFTFNVGSFINDASGLDSGSIAVTIGNGGTVDFNGTVNISGSFSTSGGDATSLIDLTHATLTSFGPSIIQGNSGTLDLGAHNFNLDSLSSTAGTMEFDGAITVATSATLNGVTLSGTTGTLTTNAGSTVSLASTTATTVGTGVTWNNGGTITWTGANNDDFVLDGTFNNQSGGIFNIHTTNNNQDVRGGGTFNNQVGGIVNMGLITAPTRQAAFNVPVNNAGTINVDYGLLLFLSTGSDTGGSYSVDADGALYFRPNFSSNLSLQTRTIASSITGAGDVYFQTDENSLIDINGIFDISGNTTIETFDTNGPQTVDFTGATINNLGTTFAQIRSAGSNTSLQTLFPASANLNLLTTIEHGVGDLTFPSVAMPALSSINNSSFGVQNGELFALTS
jgi:filamentous hemagglutinin family protein